LKKAGNDNILADKQAMMNNLPAEYF